MVIGLSAGYSSTVRTHIMSRGGEERERERESIVLTTQVKLLEEERRKERLSTLAIRNLKYKLHGIFNC